LGQFYFDRLFFRDLAEIQPPGLFCFFSLSLYICQPIYFERYKPPVFETGNVLKDSKEEIN